MRVRWPNQFRVVGNYALSHFHLYGIVWCTRDCPTDVVNVALEKRSKSGKQGFSIVVLELHTTFNREVTCKVSCRVLYNIYPAPDESELCMSFAIVALFTSVLVATAGRIVLYSSQNRFSELSTRAS